MTIGAEEYLELFYKRTQSGKPEKNNKASSQKEGERLAKKYALESCFSIGFLGFQRFLRI